MVLLLILFILNSERVKIYVIDRDKEEMKKPTKKEASPDFTVCSALILRLEFL